MTFKERFKIFLLSLGNAPILLVVSFFTIVVFCIVSAMMVIFTAVSPIWALLHPESYKKHFKIALK